MAKRKAEEERISRLSGAEQKKVNFHSEYAFQLLMYSPQILERDRKRSIRKSQGKTSVRK
jgi:hypothetical protein